MKEIQKKYNVVVQEYTDLFVAKYFDDGESTMEELKSETYWITEEIGTVFFIGDYFFNFDDIRYCIDNNVEEKQLFSWYDYCSEVRLIGRDITIPNLKSWIEGCPRISNDVISDLKTRKLNIEKLREELEDMIKGLQG